MWIYSKSFSLLLSWFLTQNLSASLRVPPADAFASQCEKVRNLLSPKIVPWNQLFSKFYSNNVPFTKFLSKKCESKFPSFPHCELTTPLTIMKPQILLRKQWHSWASYFSRKFLSLLFFEWLKTRLCFGGPKPRGRLSSKLSRKNLRVRHFYLSLYFFVGQCYQLYLI